MPAGIHRRTTCGLIVCLLGSALLGASSGCGKAAAQDDDRPLFRRGIGISHVMAWAPVEPAPSRTFVFPPFSHSNAAFGRELDALRRSGFDFVRFAVDP